MKLGEIFYTMLIFKILLAISSSEWKGGKYENMFESDSKSMEGKRTQRRNAKKEIRHGNYMIELRK